MLFCTLYTHALALSTWQFHPIKHAFPSMLVGSWHSLPWSCISHDEREVRHSGVDPINIRYQCPAKRQHFKQPFTWGHPSVCNKPKKRYPFSAFASSGTHVAKPPSIKVPNTRGVTGDTTRKLRNGATFMAPKAASAAMRSSMAAIAIMTFIRIGQTRILVFNTLFAHWSPVFQGIIYLFCILLPCFFVQLPQKKIVDILKNRNETCTIITVEIDTNIALFCYH